ncbi:hypothetical protein [Pseudarthrobacter sp. S9]|uniref:hypothetical protein n=1 Tax=Pseudarthrobacter sp. S9 TaxID=3418421 RepID=UPI003D04FDDA
MRDYEQEENPLPIRTGRLVYALLAVVTFSAGTDIEVSGAPQINAVWVFLLSGFCFWGSYALGRVDDTL